MRKIKSIIKASKVNMGGIMIDQPLPNDAQDRLDPFLLIHHWSSILQGGQHQREVGVGPHPHRGFSPVTVVFKGELHHRDSLGNDSVVSAGGVQWMNAGKGITHSERPSRKLASEGGAFEIIQFWINSPADKKMEPAVYIPKQKEELPTLNLEGVTFQIMSGQYSDFVGPIESTSHMLVARLDMKEGSRFDLDLPPNYQSLIYQLDGHMMINDQITNAKSMIVFEEAEGKISLVAKSDTRMLVLSALAINEPVESYGPFVMTNTTEIMQAIRDAQIGKMGILIEEF